MIVRIARIVALAIAVLLPATTATAQSGYPTALAFDRCKAYQKQQRAKFAGNTIFVGNSLGVTGCLFSDYPLKEAKTSALKTCDRQTPAAMRERAPCRVIALNGKVVDSAFYREMTHDYRIAVHIKSWNGSDKREEEMEGFVVFGRAKLGKGPVLNEAHLIRSDGLEICKGWVKSTGLGQSLSFTVDCIGDNRLTGTGRLSGLIKVGGHYRVGAFRAVIRNPPHKMEFWTK